MSPDRTLQNDGFHVYLIKKQARAPLPAVFTALDATSHGGVCEAQDGGEGLALGSQVQTGTGSTTSPCGGRESDAFQPSW